MPHSVPKDAAAKGTETAEIQALQNGWSQPNTADTPLPAKPSSQAAEITDSQPNDSQVPATGVSGEGQTYQPDDSQVPATGVSGDGQTYQPDDSQVPATGVSGNGQTYQPDDSQVPATGVSGNGQTYQPDDSQVPATGVSGHGQTDQPLPQPPVHQNEPSKDCVSKVKQLFQGICELTYDTNLCMVGVMKKHCMNETKNIETRMGTTSLSKASMSGSVASRIWS